MSEMTPLCGYGIGSNSSQSGGTARTKQMATPVEGGTTTMLDDGNDGMIVLDPATSLTNQNLVLPSTGPDLQVRTIASMRDIAAITFTNGTVLNAPMELLANQAVTIRRIDKNTKTWITI